jgi:diguanylate cyclase (GGDEF)-like protein/hemerythrin-like metal-binding protein
MGIVVKSPDGRYLWVNPAAERMLGRPLTRLRGQTDLDLLPRSVSGRLRETDSTRAEQSSVLVGEVEIGPGPDDPDRLCAIQEVPIADADGHVQAIAMVLADRSDQHCEMLQRREDIGRLERENRDLRVLLNDLARLATTDKLTSAWNRRRLDEAVGDELHRLERYGHPVSLLLLDIDYFKRVNDLHGHAAGDAVLASLASLLRRSFRRSDSLTRWGGEEFIVLCPNTSLSMATLLAERLRKSIAVDSFPPVERVTVSIGVAECIVGEEWQQWFDRADRALLRAKQEGRNRVSADPDTMSSEWVVNPATGRFLQLTWRNAYTSGHPLLDEQHRRLFEQSNRLLAAVLDTVPDHQIEAEFEALIQGVRDHFRDEEEILRRSGYPGVDDHGVVHRELCNSACALLEKFRSGLLGVGELFEFLARDVVAKHLLGADRDFFGYVSGLAGTAGSRSAAERRR